MSSSDEDESTSSSDDSGRYPSSLSDSQMLQVFLQSKGYLELAKNGFAEWGSRKKFISDFKQGSQSAFDTALEYAQFSDSSSSSDDGGADAGDDSDLDDSDDSSSDDSSSEDSSHVSTSAHNTLRKVKPPKKKKKKKKKKAKKPPKGDFKVIKGSLCHSDGTPFTLANTSTDVDDVTGKKFMKIYDQLTLDETEMYKNLDTDQLIKDNWTGISYDDRVDHALWAKKDAPTPVLRKRFKQPVFREKNNSTHENSQRYRLSLHKLMAGRKGKVDLSKLPSAKTTLDSKAALARAKRHNQLTLSTSAYEIVCNRFLVAQAESLYEGLSKLLQHLSMTLPQREDENRETWSAISLMRKSLMHVRSIQHEFVANISELESGKKTNRIRAEKEKLNLLFNHMWQFPLFEDDKVDKSVRQGPPLFAERPRPTNLIEWQRTVSQNVCGTKLFGTKPENTNSRNTSSEKKGTKRPRKGHYKCNHCGGEHQKGQKCAKRRRKKKKNKNKDDATAKH